MSSIIFDIETVPDGRLLQKCVFPEKPEYSPEEAIAEHQKTRLEAGKSDYIPYTYQVPVSVALVKAGPRGEMENLITLDKPNYRPYEIARQFWRIWSDYNKDPDYPTPLVTFNGRGFDLPIMELAAYRYGISIPAWFNDQVPTYRQPRYRYTTKYHLDLMEFMTNFGSTKFEGGLNLAATLLGKPGKMDVKGSDVLPMWQEGRKEEIDDYCLCDALDTYFVFLRTQIMTGQIDREEELEAVQGAKGFLEERVKDYSVIKTYLERFGSWEAPNESNQGFLSSASKP